MDFEIEDNRQIYFVQIEGKALINNIELNEGDALEITNENLLTIQTITKSHILFIEMKKE